MQAINEGGEKEGIVYLDDFEGSTANLPIHIPSTQWVIASVPQDAGTKAIERFPNQKKSIKRSEVSTVPC